MPLYIQKLDDPSMHARRQRLSHVSWQMHSAQNINIHRVVFTSARAYVIRCVHDLICWRLRLRLRSTKCNTQMLRYWDVATRLLPGYGSNAVFKRSEMNQQQPMQKNLIFKFFAKVKNNTATRKKPSITQIGWKQRKNDDDNVEGRTKSVHK